MSHHASETLLSNKVSVADYRGMEHNQDREGISRFIKQRFAERYIDPVRKSEAKHGFSIMAVSCLMIEALESFEQGWRSTRRKSRESFRRFFTGNHLLADFELLADEFYDNVRCGILHQAETTGGWKIRRRGRFSRVLQHINVNATEFLIRIERYLDEYCEHLITEPWDSEKWRNLRNKMDTICFNCEIE
jgi:hypothetical protein